jgi:hypothetical protein
MWETMWLVDAIVAGALAYLGIRRMGALLTSLLVLAFCVLAHALFPGKEMERLRWEFYFTVDLLLAAVLSAAYTLKHHWRPGPKP